MTQKVYQDYEQDYPTNSLEYLADWVFHFNPYTKQWAAIPRETYNEYWNDYKKAGVLRSKNLNTLLDLLHKAKGDSNVIDHIINGEGAE